MFRDFYGYLTQIYHLTLVLEIIMPTVLINPSIHSFIYSCYVLGRINMPTIAYVWISMTACRRQHTLCIVGLKSELGFFRLGCEHHYLQSHSQIVILILKQLLFENFLYAVLIISMLPCLSWFPLIPSFYASQLHILDVGCPSLCC